MNESVRNRIEERLKVKKMSQKIESLKKQNNPEADGFEIVEYDLYKMVIGILEERGYLDK